MGVLAGLEATVVQAAVQAAVMAEAVKVVETEPTKCR